MASSVFILHMDGKRFDHSRECLNSLEVLNTGGLVHSICAILKQVFVVRKALA